MKCPDGTEIRIIDETTPTWNKLGLSLEFEGHVLETINQKAFFQPDRACPILLEDWVKGRGKKPVEWKTLVQALETARFPELVRTLKMAFNVQPAVDETGESLIANAHSHLQSNSSETISMKLANSQRP